MENIGVFIPIIALMIPIVAIWTKHQQKLAEMNVQTTAQARRGKGPGHHRQNKNERVVQRVGRRFGIFAV